jgi:hypothetical protein
LKNAPARALSAALQTHTPKAAQERRPMPKTKEFRVAVEGATVDGRTIERAHLEQMAASYDAETYSARVNCEHIAGYAPDGPFIAYGTVLALRTEEIELTICGDAKTLLALYATIEANDQLVAVNKKGQKLFTSVEIHPNFAGTNEAYLVGLAVTDTPASLGTEKLEFAVKSRDNIFSSAHETEIEFEPETDQAAIANAVKTGLFSALASLFTGGKEPPKPAEEEKPQHANDNIDVQALSAAIGDQIVAAIKPSQDAVTTLQAELAEVKAKLSTEPQRTNFTRTPASGGTGVATDC